MITLRQIEIFKKFNGDIDHLYRIGSAKEKSICSGNDWSLIASIVQDLELVKKGIAAESFIKNLDLQLKQNLESEAVLEKLKPITKE
jgi:hypothetical protein